MTIGGSMFSGIGGFDEAMRRVGVAVAWQAELDPFCRRVLAHRFPGVRRINDVREIDESCGPIDLLCAGWPCQDLSVRAGLAGERSGLFREVVRVLELLAPQWFLLENVPGLFSSYTPVDAPPDAVDVLGRPAAAGDWTVEEDSDFEEVLVSLTELGYGLAWRCLDARYFDLAQRRERVLIVGCRGDAGRAAEVLFEPDSCSRYSAPSRGARAHHPAASLTRGSSRASHEPGRRREDDENLVAYALRRDPGGIGQEHTKTSQSMYGVRRLMPVECERLQGFPDGWTCLFGHPQQCDCPDTPRYQAIGNAVAVPTVTWILSRLRAVAEGRPPDRLVEQAA